MTPAWMPMGYMLKQVARLPTWLANPDVADICSVSGCISQPFADYTGHWRHNGHWFFDRPGTASDLAALEDVDASGLTNFYYEAWPEEYDEATASWSPLRAPADIPTEVQRPDAPQLLGFDVVTWSAGSGPECSPLSCNLLAARLTVNQHCLFDSTEEAVAALTAGLFNDSEPGPFRIVAVYQVAP